MLTVLLQYIVRHCTESDNAGRSIVTFTPMIYIEQNSWMKSFPYLNLLSIRRKR